MESLSEALYHASASGCSSVTDFISSPVCQGVQFAYLGDDVSWGPSYSLQNGELPMLGNQLHFSLKKLRAREEHGSLARFLEALPTCIPSCSHLGLWGVELASLDELAALCRGIASPLCTLRSLDFDVRLKIASPDSSCMKKRLIRDALVHNSSLQMLTIISELCSQEPWIPCSTWYLHVKLVGDDTLDVLLGVFTDLAHNSICLTSISISGSYGEIDRSGFSRSAMLDSERQLGITLSTNTSLTSLYLYNLIMPNEAFGLLFSSLNRNPNLTCFWLCAYPYLPGEVVRMLFTNLEENLYLTSLGLSYSGGEDWPSASSFLDSLRINGTLTSVELDETPYEWEFGAEEEIEGVTCDALSAQLERNRKNVEQIKGLKSLSLE